jgi:hypothetical protein
MLHVQLVASAEKLKYGLNRLVNIRSLVDVHSFLITYIDFCEFFSLFLSEPIRTLVVFSMSRVLRSVTCTKNKCHTLKHVRAKRI